MKMILHTFSLEWITASFEDVPLQTLRQMWIYDNTLSPFGREITERLNARQVDKDEVDQLQGQLNLQTRPKLTFFMEFYEV
jgi:hypothetical protein